MNELEADLIGARKMIASISSKYGTQAAELRSKSINENSGRYVENE
jgi:hypothetical protein